MQGDPELWNYAYQKNIILIGPTNLIAALKLVARDLEEERYQSRNAMEIARSCGCLVPTSLPGSRKACSMKGRIWVKPARIYDKSPEPAGRMAKEI